MIAKTIKKQIIEAMKAKDKLRLSTLKLLSSELHNAKIEKRAAGPGASGPEGILNEKEELEVVRREAKKRKDAIVAYQKADAQERADKEEKELQILQEYLPKDLTEEELKVIVDETIIEAGAKSMQEMGKVIGAVMGKVKGKADGGRVSEIVRSKLK